MTLGVDYPWTHPIPAALAAAGVEFAMRYLSNDHSKNLTRSEADALAARGIWSGVVWETTAGRALDGRAAGAADARAAADQAAACGMPGSRPIYFAVDTDTTWDRVVAYFQGVTSVLPPARVGVYGGIRIVAAAAGSGLVDWYWQASAWSGGRWDPRAHIRQLGYITIGGVQCDRNEAVSTDYGQWMPGGRTPITEEDDMPLTDTDVARVSAAVTAELTGINARDALAWATRNYDGDGHPGLVALLEAARAELAAQRAVLETLLNRTDGVDTATVVAAITASADKAFAKGLDIHLTTSPTPKES